MIISTIGRYAVLLQILLQDTTDLGASAAQSIIRDGATATAVADSLDLDTLPTADPHRILQSCSSITRKGRCKNGCTWDSSSNTCNPSGPAPTPPPFSSPPTTSPSKSPSASPTARPTDAPTSEGMGYCSDDSSKFCMNVDVCGCSSARRRLLDLDTHNNHMHRALQNCSYDKKRQCNNDSSCTWSGRNCVAITPPPVSSPTNPPSKSPMGVTEPPSKAPIDSPTRSPTNAVRLHYNIFETLFTIVCMLLTSCFSLCLHSCSLPKLLPRVNGKKILHTCHFFISKRFVLQS